jgi:predicted phosphoribosyltransferase
MFKDRTDAGVQLAEKLMSFKDHDCVVLAIPRGGLPLGAIVAKALKAPLDVVLTKKIGHPLNKEYAIGAVSMDSRIVSDVMGISQDYIERETLRIRELLAKRSEQYYKNSQPKDLKDKTIIIVDDGIATGNTILATIELVHNKEPSMIIVAIPVAPPSAIVKLRSSAFLDKVVCLETPNNFRAVGKFYEEFFPVTDENAIRIFEEYNQLIP